MKNQLLSFLLTIGLITLNGCSNLDEDNYEFAYENPLEYEWFLERSVPWGPFDLPSGSILYNFDTENSILNVQNNDESIPNILPSGAYPYSIINQDEKTYILFEEGWSHEFEGDNFGFRIIYGTQGGSEVLVIDTGETNGDFILPTDQPIYYFRRY